LGIIKVWFKEGLSEITNNQLQAEYLPLKEVTASYPPPDNQGNPIISFAIVGLIGVLVLMYTRRQIQLGASLARLTFSGVLLVLCLLGLMGLLISFWIGFVNLLQTMWILFFTAPISLILLNKGLGATRIEQA